MKKQLEKTILKNMVVHMNQIIGLNKTNFLSTGIFLKLPITFKFEQDDSVKLEKKLSLEALDSIFYSTIINSKPDEVLFVFKYNTDKDLKSIKKFADKYPLYFSFKYMVQLQHILRLHYTTTHHSMMLKHCMKAADPHSLISIANDIAVNNSLKAFFEDSPFKSFWNDIEEIIDTRFNSADPIKVLKELIEEYNISKAKIKKSYKDFDIQELNSYKYVVPKKKFFIGKNENISGQSSDTTFSSIANSIMDTIATHAKGTTAGARFKAEFDEVKVDVSWFTKLKGAFKREVYYKTKDYYQSWKNLSTTYRHHFKAPTTVNEDSKISLILSIDQSGSIQTEDLQKVLGMIKQNKKSIASIHVIMHDVDTVVYHLESTNDITDDVNFTSALATRSCDGGTSHKYVFKEIDSYLASNDVSKYIYISFSDNHSDIERYWEKHQKLKKLTTFWLSPSDGRAIDTKLYGGTNIILP